MKPKDEDDLDLTVDPKTFLTDVNHYLNHRSALILSYVDVLLNEKGPGIANEEQKEIILKLQENAEIIRALSQMIYQWLEIHKEY